LNSEAIWKKGGGEVLKGKVGLVGKALLNRGAGRKEKPM